ncbi:MAG: hypothetical protein KGZ81_13675 [Flavobacteriales bacterium]|nr:hypothetical protein [Flavobacteriales bacterium]
MTFFDEGFEKELAYLGTVSGREEDKISELSLEVKYSDQTPFFNNARLALICRKLYSQEYKSEGFIDPAFKEEFYPDKDYHTLYC